MKISYKLLILAILVINISLMFSNSFNLSETSTSHVSESYMNFNRDIFEEHGKFKLNLVDHLAIYINGDSQFHTQAGSEGWDVGGRDGTKNAPYLINGLNITNPAGSAVSIFSTNVYYVLEGNFFFNGTYGVYLQNAQNGIVTQNEILHSRYNAVRLSSAHNNSILENQINGVWDAYNAQGDVVRLSGSHNNTIQDNNIFNGIKDGIELYNSNNNTIITNSIHDNNDPGINPDSASTGNVFMSNIVYNNRWIGIYAGNNNTVFDNTVFNQTQEGIRAGTYSIIANNTVYENPSYGIWSSGGDFNVIANNTIFNSSTGIYFSSGSNNNSLISNNLYNNTYDFRSSYSGNFSLINNNVEKPFEFEGSLKDHFLLGRVSGNLIYGKPFLYWQNRIGGTVPDSQGQIMIVNSSDIEISGLTLSSGVSVTISDSKDIKIFDNVFAYSASPLRIYFSENVHIVRNEIYNNTLSGIYLYSSIKTTITDNHLYFNNLASSGSNGGIYAYYSNQTHIFNNEFDKNLYFNLYLGESYFDFIANNIIHNSSFGIYLQATYYSTITSNLVYNHSLVGVSVPTYNVTVVGNTIFNNSGYGLRVLGAYYARIISNNFQANNLGGSSQVEDYGVGNYFDKNYFDDWIGSGNYSIDGAASNFDINPIVSQHTLTVPTFTAPVSGSGVNLSENVIIEWTGSSDSVSHSISYWVYYSKDGGVTWNLLAGEISALNFEWETRFDQNSQNYLLKLLAVDDIGTQSFSTSVLFEVDNVAHILSVPTIISPTGSGDQSGIVSIRWEESIETWGQPVLYSVYYSDDDGSSWNLLASNLSLEVFYWDVSEVSQGTSYKIRIVASSNGIFGGLTSEQVSDNAFSIVAGGEPNGLFSTITTTATKTTTVIDTAEGGPVPGLTILMVFIPLFLFVVYNIKYRKDLS